MNNSFVELEENELMKYDGGLGVTASFIIGGVAGIIVVGGIILLVENVKG